MSPPDPLAHSDALLAARYTVVEIAARVRRAAHAFPDGDDNSWRAPAQRAYVGRLQELRASAAAAESSLGTVLAAIDQALAAVSP